MVKYEYSVITLLYFSEIFNTLIDLYNRGPLWCSIGSVINHHKLFKNYLYLRFVFLELDIGNRKVYNYICINGTQRVKIKKKKKSIIKIVYILLL